MFKAGAIKIQLGSKKTMFYIPGLDSNDPKAIQEWADRSFDDPDIPLLPAMWLPTARYHDMDKIFFRSIHPLVGILAVIRQTTKT